MKFPARLSISLGFVLGLIFAIQASAAPRPILPKSPPSLGFASMFTDNMVLQRDKKVPVWGTGVVGKNVTVAVNGQTVSAAVGHDGKWMVTLDPMPAGGPFELTLTDGSRTLSLRNVMAGEVWFCSGQSNMAFVVKEVIGAAQELAEADKYPDIHLYHVSTWGSFAREPQENAGGKWSVGSSKSVSDFSAVGYLFARALKKSVLKDVPVGLIDASRGATRIESWISRPTLEKQYNMAELRDSAFGATISSCFNGMIHPAVPYGVRGVLWYQGESNASRPAQYIHLFKTMVDEWRGLWNDPQLPFLTVQLPGYGQKFDDDYFTLIREAQRRCAQEENKVWMAVSIDVGSPNDVHPKNKKPVAERLARIALEKVYGKEVAWTGPMYDSMQIRGNTILVKFKGVGKGLKDKDGGIVETFAIAGKDGVYKKADAKIEGADTVVVSSPDVSEPVSVHYAWTPDPKADLYDSAGLPAIPFATEKVELKDAPIKPTPVQKKSAPARGMPRKAKAKARPSAA